MTNPEFKPLRAWLRGRWLLAAAWCVISTVGWASLKPGTPAPDFELPALDGRGLCTLKPVKGHCLLVLLRADQRFTSETLALCRRLSGRFPATPGHFQPILIWVGPLPAEADAVTTATLGVGWRIAHDAHEQVGEVYQMVVSPTIYLIDPAGVVTFVFPAWNPLLEMQLTGILNDEIGLKAPASAENSPQDITRIERANLYFNMGRSIAAMGLWEEALGHFERGLTLNPQAAVPLAEAARAAYMIGQHDKSEVYAQRALDLVTTQPLALAVMRNLQGHPTSLVWEGDTTASQPKAGAPAGTPPMR